MFDEKYEVSMKTDFIGDYEHVFITGIVAPEILIPNSCFFPPSRLGETFLAAARNVFTMVSPLKYYISEKQQTGVTNKDED